MGMPKIWAMTDVYGLDDMLLDMLPQPVVALMLLFPINQKVYNYHTGVDLVPESNFKYTCFYRSEINLMINFNL